jgi:hypothetical protein
MKYGEDDWRDYEASVRSIPPPASTLPALRSVTGTAGNTTRWWPGRYDTLRVLRAHQEDWHILCDGVELPCGSLRA